MKESLFVLEVCNFTAGGVKGLTASPNSQVGLCHLSMLVLFEALEDHCFSVLEMSKVLAPTLLEVPRLFFMGLTYRSSLLPLILNDMSGLLDCQLSPCPSDLLIEALCLGVLPQLDVS